MYNIVYINKKMRWVKITRDKDEKLMKRTTFKYSYLLMSFKSHIKKIIFFLKHKVYILKGFRSQI